MVMAFLRQTFMKIAEGYLDGLCLDRLFFPRPFALTCFFLDHIILACKYCADDAIFFIIVIIIIIADLIG